MTGLYSTDKGFKVYLLTLIDINYAKEVKTTLIMVDKTFIRTI